MQIFNTAASIIPANHAAQEWLSDLRADAETEYSPLIEWTATLKGYLRGLHAGGIISTEDLYDLLDQIQDILEVTYCGNLTADCQAAMHQSHLSHNGDHHG